MASEPTESCRRCLNGLALAILAATFGSAIARGQCRYEMTIIQGPTHPVWGTPATIATGLNNLGHVVGYYSYLGEDDRGFVWTAQNGFQTLPLPPGATAFRPADINDVGLIVGTADVPTGFGAFVYYDGAYSYLPPQSGGAWSWANAVNNAFCVVGGRSTGDPNTPGLDVTPFNAFVWCADTFVDLGIPRPPYSEARDINDTGVVVGYSGVLLGQDEAFRWEDGDLQLLGPIPSASTSTASAINNAGVIIGVGAIPNSSPPAAAHASWMASQWELIPCLPDAYIGAGRDLNDAGIIVGACSLSPGHTAATAWFDRQPYRLDDLVAGTDTFDRAWAINDSGEIIAHTEGRSGLLRPLALPSDFDGDGDIDLSDLAIELANFGCITNCPGDSDGDGDSDLTDLTLLLAGFGMRCP